MNNEKQSIYDMLESFLSNKLSFDGLRLQVRIMLSLLPESTFVRNERALWDKLLICDAPDSQFHDIAGQIRMFDVRSSYGEHDIMYFYDIANRFVTGLLSPYAFDDVLCKFVLECMPEDLPEEEKDKLRQLYDFASWCAEEAGNEAGCHWYSYDDLRARTRDFMLAFTSNR